MTDKYQNKYRIPSARLKNWDYRTNAAYFVTICTKNREHYFGEIIDGEMQLSEIGEIVENEWIDTFKLRPDMNLMMDKFTIMPNHFHAIIIIGKNKYNAGNDTDAMHRVSSFGPQSKNLASIIRGFKSAVTKNARKIYSDFGWQTRYYDHIIRDDESHTRIQQYIINNPQKWTDDKMNLKEKINSNTKTLPLK